MRNEEGWSFRFTAALETLLKDQLSEHERLRTAARNLVPEAGVEPTRRLAASSDFKSDASASFATPAS